MIPGANLLNMAARLVRLDKPQHVRYKGETKDAAGIVTPEYYSPVTITASMQPVPRDLVEKMALDLNKSYMMAYTSIDLRDLKRGAPCDMLNFAGRVWNVESNTDWKSQDGWRGSLVCDIGPVPQ